MTTAIALRIVAALALGVVANEMRRTSRSIRPARILPSPALPAAAARAVYASRFAR